MPTPESSLPPLPQQLLIVPLIHSTLSPRNGRAVPILGRADDIELDVAFRCEPDREPPRALGALTSNANTNLLGQNSRVHGGCSSYLG